MTDTIEHLSRLGVLEARGPDAATFLHAQLCGDLLGLAPGRSIFTAWCSPKGRVLATLLVAPGNGGALIVLPADIRDTVLRRLRMYVLRSRVEMLNRDDVVVAGCLDPAQPGLPPARALEAPWQWLQADSVLALSLPGTAGTRLMLVAPPDRLEAGRVADAGDAWRLEDIQARIPWIGASLSDECLPQELGLEALGGLSYRKGCYPGQEVIARVHYRGRARRTLRRIRAGSALGEGGRLLDAEGRAAGRIITMESATDAWLGLAVVDTEAGVLRSGDADSQPVELLADT